MDSNKIKNKISNLIAFGLVKGVDCSSKSLLRFEGSFIDMLKYKWGLGRKVNKFLKDINKNYILTFGNGTMYEHDMKQKFKSQKTIMSFELTPQPVCFSPQPILKKGLNLKIQNVLNLYCNKDANEKTKLKETEWVQNLYPNDLSTDRINKYAFQIISSRYGLIQNKEVSIDEYNKVLNSENVLSLSYMPNSKKYYLKVDKKIKLTASSFKLHYDYMKKCFKLTLHIDYIDSVPAVLYTIKNVDIPQYKYVIKTEPQPPLESIDLNNTEDPDFQLFGRIQINQLAGNGPLEEPFCAYIDSIEETYNDPNPCQTAHEKESKFFKDLANNMTGEYNKEIVTSIYGPINGKKRAKRKNKPFKIKSNESFV